MRRRWVSSLPSLMLLSLCLACDIPERPKTTTISNPPAFRPSSPKDVKTPEQALGAIITVCRDALHLPVVNPVHLSVYKNTASYAFYGYGWSTLPFDVRNSCSISLKGPTRFQRRGPPNSAERSDEVILTVYNKPP